MSQFIVQGGNTLQGTIRPQGSKNEAFQVMCAALLTKEPVTLYNVPAILDVAELFDLLTLLGVQVEQLDRHTYRLQADNLSIDDIDPGKLRSNANQLRGSVLILGPLLARLGKAVIYLPGGDKIGRRKLDTHFVGVQKLGASLHYDEQARAYIVKAPHLKGAYILLDESSVTATANIIMAAVLAQGETTIYSAACEPHIQQLCRMLVKMGASIEGIGSNLLTIRGVASLHGTSHTIAPDIIEIGSFIGLAALTQSNLTIHPIEQIELLEPVLLRFSSLGIHTIVESDRLIIPRQDEYDIQSGVHPNHILTLADAVWPGLPSDLLSIFLVTAIQAKGSVLIHQKMYESRLFFVDNLIEMGAKLILCDPHRVHVVGLNRSSRLRGIRMTSPDIRAGIALLIAALSAEGQSVIDNAKQIDRGYEDIENRLKALGAVIKRVD